MRFLVRLLYAGAANLTSAAARFVPPTDSKTALAMRARVGIRARYVRWAAEHRAQSPLLWMHAPSVGEGLQARPVLSLMRTRHPQTQLAYTFFSPSAEDFSRTVDVDFRDYLPFDTAADTGSALDALRPTAVVFSKLDVWPEFVRQARHRGVRLGMVSATLAARSGRRGAIAGLVLRDAYAALDLVGAVDEGDAARLVERGVRASAISVTGDTRFDQVAQRAEQCDRASPLLSRLASSRPTVVAGSTWPSDESRLLEAVVRARTRVPALRIIVAPHEPTTSALDELARWAAGARLTLARVDDPSAGEADVVLVDRFGLLGDLYALADVAFVGGGFHDAGLHSVLEPAAFGAPVLFGPRHQRSRDAALLLQADAGRAVHDVDTLVAALTEWLEQADRRQATGRRGRDLVWRNRGAAERSLQLVERLLA